MEEPGKYFSPMGPLIPAGGRLLLAIAECLAKQRGLTYAMCDTDSMFFVRDKNHKNMSRRVFYLNVQRITEQFQRINPYAPAKGKVDPMFNIEDVNYGKDGQFKPLYILSISAKRYALANIVDAVGNDFKLNADMSKGHPIIRKATGNRPGPFSAFDYDDSFLPPHEADRPDKLCKGKGNPNCSSICGDMHIILAYQQKMLLQIRKQLMRLLSYGRDWRSRSICNER